MNIRILSLGDEYSVNSQRYLAKIARCDDVSVTAGNLVLPNATLEKHSEALINNLPLYSFEYYDRGCLRTDTIENCTAEKAFSWDNWDYVTVQQGGAYAGLAETFMPYLGEVASSIRGHLPKSVLVLNETWAFSKDCTSEHFSMYGNNQDNMYEMIRASYIMAAEDASINVVFPVGEAWQNARKTDIGDNLTIDGCHGNRMGEFLAGAVWYEILTGNDMTKNGYRLPFVPAESVAVLKEVAHEIAKTYSLHK